MVFTILVLILLRFFSDTGIHFRSAGHDASYAGLRTDPSLAAALEERCDFARSYMSRIERGKANLSLDATETLAGGLKVLVVRLFDD
jgi:transcriptional regulator with XRE-family HTH domain